MRATRGASSATSAGGGRRPQTRNQPAVYEDFTPLIENLRDESSHIVLIHLPGFMKEQLRILAESNRRILRVRGERLVLGNKWARFQEEIPVPHHCQITEIRAKFERGILRVTMPRRIPAAAANDQPLPSAQPVVRHHSPPPSLPPPSPPQQLEEPEHVSPPPPRFLPQQPPVVLPPLVRTPSPPSLKQPEPPVILPPRSPQIPQSKLPRADDHDRYHDAPANVTQEKQAVYEEPKASPPRIVLRPRPTSDGEQQQQGPPTIFDNSSANQEDHRHHIPQPKSQPLSDHHDDVYLTQLEQILLADSHRPKQSGAHNAGGAAAVHEEMMRRRRHVQQGVEDKGFDKASSKLKENGDASVGGLWYSNGWKRMMTEERQLAVNAGVAILVAFSLGAYVSYSLLFPE